MQIYWTFYLQQTLSEQALGLKQQSRKQKQNQAKSRGKSSFWFYSQNSKMKEEKLKQKFHLPPHLNQTHEGMYYVNCKMNIIHIQLPKRQQCVVYIQIKASRNEVRIISCSTYYTMTTVCMIMLLCLERDSGKLSFHE